MRLDKFLKVSRLIKRRTLARKRLNAGVLLLTGRYNQRAMLPSVIFGTIVRQPSSNGGSGDLKETVRAADASSLYRMIKEEE